ncbi:MAG TPA: PDZ domain-containing protein [Egibacteraceae bacterium]|nr:PDZ domain-containing protein [Egibacteraceae bacterium]
MRVLRAGFLPVSIALLLTAAFVVPLPLFRERPGRLLSLGACVTVAEAGALDGDYLLMTITVLRTTVADAVPAIFDPDTRIRSQREVIPPGVERGEFFRQQRDVFVTTADVAAAVGLEAAGLDATFTGEGVRVLRVMPGSPAEGVLAPGDVITAVGDRPVTVEQDLRTAVARAGSDETVRLGFERDGEQLDADLVPVEMQGTPVIGVVPQTVNARVDLPVPVEVASGTVGGPSAGLTIALTVYDKIREDVDLAAGRVIAGTGAIDPTGRVGPVGGVGLKVVAAERVRADVFLTPAANHAEALAALPPGSPMQIVPVETFDDARAALEDPADGEPRGGGPDRDECPFGEAA